MSFSFFLSIGLLAWVVYLLSKNRDLEAIVKNLRQKSSFSQQDNYRLDYFKEQSRQQVDALQKELNELRRKSAQATQPSQSAQDLNKEKGNKFEIYIAKKFNQEENKKFFTIETIRSDKGVDGFYPKSNEYPDLEIEFDYAKKQSFLAIECKWRKNWFMNGVQWSKEYQLKHYNQYAQKRNFPVFVAIGIGGIPNNPDEVFVLPLDVISQISTTFFNKEERQTYMQIAKVDLERYRQQKEGYFFFDRTKNTLTLRNK